MLSVLVILSFCFYYLRCHYRQAPQDRLSSETRGIKFLTSDYYVLFVNLLVGDLVQSLGFALDIHVSPPS